MVFAAIAVLCVLAAQHASWGQALNGSVVGNVKDSSDAMIVGPVVTICEWGHPHFANPGSNVSNLVLNGDGTVKNLAGFAQVQAVANTGRDGIDERQFRFVMRISF